jgi:hypothetical protein
MAQPFPPQGQQQQFTERPSKIYGEQYLAGQPVPIGVATYAFPPVYQEGDARVYLAGGGVKAIAYTDWVITQRYSGQPIDVLSNEEFAERFGGQPDITS